MKMMAVQALSHPNSPVHHLLMVRTEEMFLPLAGRLHSCWCLSKQTSFTHFPFILLLASHETSHQLSCFLSSVLDSRSSAVPCCLWTGATAAPSKHSSGWLLLLLSCNQMQVPPGLCPSTPCLPGLKKELLSHEEQAARQELCQALKQAPLH